MIAVQVGQCGNQLGAAVVEALGDDALREGGVARAVLADTEPKVVAAALSARGRGWAYDEAQAVVCRQSGAGNNWAAGYATDPGAVVERVRRELERAPADALLLLHSVAGGTGSGLGSRVAEALRDALPGAHLLSAAVWPFARGEVTVQPYNALLTLSHLQRFVDGVLLFENDRAAQTCRDALRVRNASYAQLNEVIAAEVAAGLGGNCAAVGSVLQHLCAHPAFKMLRTGHAPRIASESRAFEAHRWPAVVAEAAQLRGARTVAEYVVLRGPESAGVDLRWPSAGCVAWNPQPLLVERSARPFNDYDKACALITNGPGCVAPIETAVRRASDLFGARAFLHQYAAHGVGEGEFEEAFDGMEQVLASYGGV